MMINLYMLPAWLVLIIFDILHWMVLIKIIFNLFSAEVLLMNCYEVALLS
jgi:hypothetical protein